MAGPTRPGRPSTATPSATWPTASACSMACPTASTPPRPRASEERRPSRKARSATSATGGGQAARSKKVPIRRLRRTACRQAPGRGALRSTGAAASHLEPEHRPQQEREEGTKKSDTPGSMPPGERGGHARQGERRVAGQPEPWARGPIRATAPRPPSASCNPMRRKAGTGCAASRRRPQRCHGHGEDDRLRPIDALRRGGEARRRCGAGRHRTRSSSPSSSRVFATCVRGQPRPPRHRDGVGSWPSSSVRCASLATTSRAPACAPRGRGARRGRDAGCRSSRAGYRFGPPPRRRAANRASSGRGG